MAETIETARRGSNSRGRRSRERLLRAAADCFGERGYSATRISDITAAAGMSQGAFYRHFKDKNDILVEALREPLDELLATTAVGAGLEIDRAALTAGNTAFFAIYARHRKVMRVIREAAALHEPGLVELWLGVRGKYVERIVRWLQELQAAGRLETRDVQLMAEALGSVLDQMAYTRIGLSTAPTSEQEIELLGQVTGEIWYRALRGSSL
ncbi:MAG TPA: TetR/AcrR family transcriptional regulator [Solirubrobacteraceae bacterium]|nr:TetR/AcrR family transcriptional regulator [Solirubrobacteraceae bacterium]